MSVPIYFTWTYKNTCIESIILNTLCWIRHNIVVTFIICSYNNTKKFYYFFFWHEMLFLGEIDSIGTV